MYSVISVIVDGLPVNTEKWTIDKFVAFGVQLFHSWAASSSSFFLFYFSATQLARLLRDHLFLVFFFCTSSNCPKRLVTVSQRIFSCPEQDEERGSSMDGTSMRL